MALIAPSLLAANFARLGEALDFIKAAGASVVHVDVMDGHFVPEISVGQPVVQGIRKATVLTLDLHLLIERPERYVPEFLEIGADRIAVHAEATSNLHRNLRIIRKRGAKAGVALNVSTDVATVRNALDEADYLLILAADVGFPDSAFAPTAINKVRRARELREQSGLKFEIQVEGGIGADQVPELIAAGADILVTGSYIFQENPKARLENLMRLAR